MSRTSTHVGFVKSMTAAIPLMMLIPSSAFAEFTVNSPFGNAAVSVQIGTFDGLTNLSNLGAGALFKRLSDGACQFVLLGFDVFSENRFLLRDTANVHTGSGNDSVVFVSSANTTPICFPSQTITYQAFPMLFNGHALYAFGNGGADFMRNTNGSSFNGVLGGSGNDTLISQGGSAGAGALGGDGDDLIHALSYSNFLGGEAGNDTFCALNGVHLANGGAGTDTGCGAATIVIDVENVSCTSCNAPL